MISFTAVLIILVIAYFAKDILSAPSKVNPLGSPASAQPVVEQTFTPHTLAKFDGREDPKIYIGVRGNVYDVSAGSSFYGPGGPYENFSGRDASRGLAKNSFDPAMLTPLDEPIDLLEDLSKDEIEALDGWESLFKGKYVYVGKLRNEIWEKRDEEREKEIM